MTDKKKSFSFKKQVDEIDKRHKENIPSNSIRKKMISGTSSQLVSMWHDEEAEEKAKERDKKLKKE